MLQYQSIGRGLPKAVKALLIANVSIFVLTTIIPVRGWNLIFGLVPALVNHRFMVWQFFSYMFLHGDFGHIFWNMLMLWMFSTELEYNWGSRDFLKYYFICGIGGGLLVWFTATIGFFIPDLSWLSSYVIPTVGASGAIFGVLVAYGLMWPNRMIFVMGILPMKAWHMVLIFGGIDLFKGLSGNAGGIAVFAHVGGGITGYIYLKYGWRIMAHVESIINGFKARKFTVTEGGKSSGLKHNSHNSHPDIDEEVNRILDKIASDGMDSLSDREKRLLDRASKKRD
ncbi:rhomboid family intramembrane serine protease [Candidatus Latescibacterota bacterium]